MLPQQEILDQPQGNFPEGTNYTADEERNMSKISQTLIVRKRINITKL